MKKIGSKLNLKTAFFVFYMLLGLFCPFMDVLCVEANDINPENISRHSCVASGWNKMINTEREKDEKYPNKRKITPETVRLTINEYYIPQISELLDKGVDCFEWLNQLDDPYLNRYKVDIRVDPDDERLKLFWKRAF